MLRPLCRRLLSSSSTMREVETVIRTTPVTQSSYSVGAWKAFRPNCIIRPHDLSYKSRRVAPPPPRKWPDVGPPPAQARYSDVFHQLDLDPLSQATNPVVLSEYVSEMGKIAGRSRTGLTMKSQRRLGKAIRRAKMMGVIPVLSAPKIYRR